MDYLKYNLLHVDTLGADFAEMQKLANDGDYDGLADHIAMLCYNYMGNRLDMMSDTHTFTITSGKVYSVNIPSQIHPNDLIAAAIKHGADYYPEGSFLQGKFFTCQYRQ